ncbi:type VII secretion-associated serine protease mycosin [Mycolicibacter kumamotonensis]|jgi:membrane-anchored mycosin MYCP|uniref:Type VII secretion-associated serine protease mycosin n=1 Tax=Mycolicibacter kumamotonensis TaxID=354243 RepID=A0A1X0E5U3_9MYCO|nr:type VII secretion-associated serine protease mycosin [Mycolicibacter kumamotonensis]ORA80074.1 type VII secretion-associated serine protease mycosin [Mycolicibacter kumamotonensis]
MTRSTTKAGMAGAAVALTLLLAGPPASAITPPKVDPTVPPPSGAPGPVAAMEQRADCASSGLLPGSDVSTAPAGQRMLDLPAAWQFTRGEGQTVAVIDTGVRPGPRLPAVEPGGDYIGTTDGLTDCDGHGTLVAGIIAGQPAPDGQDGFTGVAPAARLLSLRTASATISPRLAGDDPRTTRVVVDITALSRAIVHAADLGARVITISTTTCLPADRNIDQTELGAALRYAAVEKDALIVAAAGDSGQTGSVGGGGEACESNPLTDLSRPHDPRNWTGVTSLSVPSWWHPYVLSVASLSPAGHPSAFTMAGPWVGVAAPGEDIVSVSNRDDGSLANGLPGNQGRLVPLSGTGYAAGYVAGVAALVRSRYPELNAMQVVHRIVSTAHNGARAPSGLVGAGTVDAVAALTWELPPVADPADSPSKKLSPPPAPQPEDPAPRIVAFAGTALLAGLVAAVAVGAAAAARRRKENQL